MSVAPKIDWPDDPVVAEVLAIRARFWQEGGGTVAGFLEVIRRRAAAKQGDEPRRTPGQKAKHPRKRKQTGKA